MNSARFPRNLRSSAMLRPRVVRFYPITSVFPKSENSSAADGDTVFLQISDGGNLIFNRVGAADQFGVTFRVGLQVHVIAPNTVVSKEPCGFFRQNTDRCTDFQSEKGKFPAPWGVKRSRTGTLPGAVQRRNAGRGNAAKSPIPRMLASRLFNSGNLFRRASSVFRI